MDVSEGLDINTSGGKILVLIKWVKQCVEVTVWWSMIFVEALEFLVSFQLGRDLVVEVLFGEKTEARHPVVSASWLVVPGVAEAASV